MIQFARVDLSLVVPVHHCGGRLEHSLHALALFLDQAPVRAELLLVDDRGTDPRANALLRALAERPDVRLIENERNEGKGFSVRRGMLAAVGQYRVFTDADLAYPLTEVWKITDALERGADVAIACRALRGSRPQVSAAMRPYYYTRYLVSRAFNHVVRATLLPGVLDTQAGLKGYTARAARAVFSRVHIAGFGFDLECLYVARLRGLTVEQVPVQWRCEQDPSTVRVARDARRMLGDLARIRWRGLTGVYSGEPASAEWRAVTEQRETAELGVYWRRDGADADLTAPNAAGLVL
jgi:dolichyl-phosphate beta-glucosyltransferase